MLEVARPIALVHLNTHPASVRQAHA